MPRLTLAVLGGFWGQLDASAPLTLPTRKAQALLTFLSLPPGQLHLRGKLASLLWGGMRESELLALAERLDDPALLLEGHHALWPVLVWLGKADAARGHLQQGIALYDKARHRSHAFVYGGHDPGVCCWKVASWASWILGHPARALEESV